MPLMSLAHRSTRDLAQLGRKRRRERYKTIINLITEYNDFTWNATSWPTFQNSERENLSFVVFS